MWMPVDRVNIVHCQCAYTDPALSPGHFVGLGVSLAVLAHLLMYLGFWYLDGLSVVRM